MGTDGSLLSDDEGLACALLGDGHLETASLTGLRTQRTELGTLKTGQSRGDSYTGESPRSQRGSLVLPLILPRSLTGL